MTLKFLPYAFSVCSVPSLDSAELSRPFTFTAVTDEECSLVCRTEMVPKSVLKREDGWVAFKVDSVLDFSLIGILAGISEILATAKIGIFAVSTYNTDYIFLKKENKDTAISVLRNNGYEIIQ